MKEISEEFVVQFLAGIDCSPRPELFTVADGQGDRDLQKILPVILDLFINKLKLNNPADFLQGVVQTRDLSERDMTFIKRRMAGAGRVIDVGCGWGAFTKMLSEEYQQVYAIDWVLEHAVATKILSPDARVYHGDARDMHLLNPGYFDAVFARSIIEHVGDSTEATGKSVLNYHHQHCLVKELSRICRDGGQLFITTGNYIFPRDGEVNLWFYHWLPAKQQAEYCTKKNISADNYWLLTWTEMEFLLNLSGLTVESVTTADKAQWGDRFLNNLDRAFPGIDPFMIELWRDLVESDPQFFSSWDIVAKKNAEQLDISKMNNACYYSRAMCHSSPSKSYCKMIDQGEMTISDIIYLLVRKLRRYAGKVYSKYKTVPLVRLVGRLRQSEVRS